MVKKIHYLAILFQIITLILVLTGLGLNRNGQNGMVLFYIGFSIQIMVLMLVVFLGIKKQQANSK